jgi:hypothetical protein
MKKTAEFTMGYGWGRGSGLVGRTNGADVAAPFAASFADSESPGTELTDSLGQRYGSTGAYRNVLNTYPFGDLKGDAVREGFYFIFGK